MASSVLSEQAYQKLLRELKSILAAAEAATSEQKLTGYWSLGQRIVAERLSPDSGYSDNVLRDVSHDLGVSTRTLQHAVQLHLAYPQPPDPRLSWAHYKVLATLPTKKERTDVARRAIAQVWSVRELKAAVQAASTAESSGAPAIERPTGSAYLYLATRPHVVDADTLDLDVDLGFQTWTHRRIRLAGVDAPESGSPEGRAARNFVHKQLSRARTLVLKSHSLDLHGRSLAHLFFSSQSTDIDTCYQSGHHLNALLVASGHAVVLG